MSKSHSWRVVFACLSFSGLSVLTLSGSPGANLLHAQTHPVVEASATARAAWQDVRAAFNQGDLDAAAAAIEIATTAWPTQVAYQRARAMVAARRDDIQVLESTLRILTSLESGADLADDEAVASLRSNPAVDRAMNRLIEASAPVLRSEVWRNIPDTTFYAEGIDASPHDSSIYVASIRHRTVVEINSIGTIRDLDLARHPRVGAVFGVRVDPVGQSLWVTTGGLARSAGYTETDDGIAALLKVSISDGAIEARWDLPSDGAGHILGDLAIGPEGDVFVTDSDSPQLLRLRSGGESFELITHPLFRSLQGVVAHPNGRFVYVADYSHGLMLVDLETEEVTRLPDAPGKTSLGLDGIVWHRGSIIGIQNGVAPPRVTRFDLDGSGTRIVNAETIDRNIPLADEPTIGTLLGDDFIYVANSQWEKYDDEGNRRKSTGLEPTVILRLPL